MLSPEYLKKLIPGIVTRIAITYPFDYIESISFFAKHKLIASCFWRIPKERESDMQELHIGKNCFPGCYIYNCNETLDTSEVEIIGTDTDGRNFIVSLPLTHFIGLKIAS